MGNYTSEYKLECYQILYSLNKKENIWAVEDRVSGQKLVMCKIPSSSKAVYKKLMEINHPNIIQIKDMFTCNGDTYIIESFFEGKVLTDYLCKLDKKQMRSIGRQVLAALDQLHSMQIVHRDVKPDNIMINDSGQVKLIDFHISRIYCADKDSDTTLKGSAAYAAPEQFGFSQTDLRTDIYSLGVTLNELATGKMPEEIPCGGLMGKVIQKCVELDPKRRYQNCGEVVKALEHIHRKRRIMVLLCAIIAIFVGVLWWTAICPTEYNAPEKSLPFTASVDRVIRVSDPEAYPSVLLTKKQEQRQLNVDLGDGNPVAVAVEKRQQGVNLSVSSSKEREEVDFQFSEKIGHKTAADWEVLFHDIDGDGTDELLVAGAVRKKIDTPDPQNRYYLTEHSQVWCVYLEENNFKRSSPLTFYDQAPTLDGNYFLRDSVNNNWYSFQDGKWVCSN